MATLGALSSNVAYAATLPSDPASAPAATNPARTIGQGGSVAAARVSAQVADAPSPTPSVELAANRNLPVDIEDAPSPAPHGALHTATFDTTA